VKALGERNAADYIQHWPSRLVENNEDIGASRQQGYEGIVDAVFEKLLQELNLLFPLRKFAFSFSENFDENPLSSVKLQAAKFLIPNLQTLASIDSDKALSSVKAKGEAKRKSNKEAFAVTDEIMKNFLTLKNFEMKRSRYEKCEYDKDLLSSYVYLVFDTIKTKSSFFMKAFAKPIYFDFYEILQNFREQKSSEIYVSIKLFLTL
jgi:hypothetical protein